MKTLLFIGPLIAFGLTGFAQDLFSPNYVIGLASNASAPTYIYLDSTNSFTYPAGNGGWSFTNPQGTLHNGYALLDVFAGNGTSSTMSMSSVTYDGFTLSYITNYLFVSGSSSTYHFVYGGAIGNDGAGTKTVAATLASTPSTHFSSFAVISVWNNVNQSTPPTSLVSTRAGGSTSRSITMTTVNGGVMIGALCLDSGGGTLVADHTILDSTKETQYTNCTAASSTIGWTFATSGDGAVGVVLAQ